MTWHRPKIEPLSEYTPSWTERIPEPPIFPGLPERPHPREVRTFCSDAAVTFVEDERHREQKERHQVILAFLSRLVGVMRRVSIETRSFSPAHRSWLGRTTIEVWHTVAAR